MDNPELVFYLQRTIVRWLIKSHTRGSFVYFNAYAAVWSVFVRLVEILDTLSSDGIKLASERVDAVIAISFSENASELRRFLGMTNFIRDYILLFVG